MPKSSVGEPSNSILISGVQLLAWDVAMKPRGRYSDAIECFERATVLSDRVPTSIGALGRAYALAGRPQESRQLLSELDELARQRYVSPYAKVLIYLGL